MFQSLSRIFTWGYGIYLVATTELGFWQWLFYLWYT